MSLTIQLVKHSKIKTNKLMMKNLITFSQNNFSTINFKLCKELKIKEGQIWKYKNSLSLESTLTIHKIENGVAHISIFKCSPTWNGIGHLPFKAETIDESVDEMVGFIKEEQDSATFRAFKEGYTTWNEDPKAGSWDIPVATVVELIETQIIRKNKHLFKNSNNDNKN